MRYLYSLLLYMLSPLILLYLNKRAKKNPDYKKNWNQRFGLSLNNPSNKPIIWLHAVSVGETRAMAKIVEILQTKYPNYQLLITQMTPTGRKTAADLYPNVLLHFIPYDMPHAVINFYKTFKPKVGIIMETEIWPNLIHYANKLNIPLILANARLSPKSFNGYNKVKFIISPILNKLNNILAQDEVSYNNFKNLGFNNQLDIIGNTKFDIVVEDKYYKIAQQLKKHSKKIVVFASTRENEEKLILDNLPKEFDYIVIIIPRHPERFNEVDNLIKQTGLSYAKRSDNTPIDDNVNIYLGNSMGEMFAYYLLSDIAVIGGSFENLGGQNLIEPISLNKPVIFGKYMFNFKLISENAIKSNCAIQVNDIQQCFKEIDMLLKDNIKYLDMVNNCNKFINTYQGASQKVVETIEQYL